MRNSWEPYENSWRKRKKPSPINFSKVLCLKFNLPPLHIMKIKFIPEIAKHLVDTEKKEYFTKTAQNKLKFATLSATIGNFRNKEEKAFHYSHLPINLFQ